MSKEIKGDNSFMIRLRSSIVLMLIIIAVLVIGSYALLAAILYISIRGMYELYRIYSVEKTFGAIIAYLSAALWMVSIVCEFEKLPSWFHPNSLLPVIISFFLVLLLAAYVLRFDRYDSEKITVLFFGFFYVAITLSYILRIRLLPCGEVTVWLVFIGAWGSDVFAYLFGRKLGKHKIAPVLSPNKTVEGCIGGIIGSVAIAIIYSLCFRAKLNTVITSPVIVFAIVAFVCSPISMIGDMAASGIKRNKGIKDYGRLIPGHGGVLDRFDSVIILAPIVYYLLDFLENI